MTHDVFICHASEDRTIAQAVCSKLEENRIRCWIAPRDVVPGSEYAQSIVEAIAGTRLTVLVFSESSNRSPHVHRELERTASHGIPILPFRVQDVVPSPAVEYFISDAHWLDAVTPPVEKHLDYLVGTVRLLLDREAARESGVALPETAVPQPPTRPTGRRRLLVAAVAVAAALVAAVLTGWLLMRPDGTPAPEAGAGAASASPEGSAPPGTEVEPFVDEFEGSLGAGWSWVDESPDDWTLTDGELRLRVLEAPPYRNVLLRELPATSYSVEVHLRFEPTTPGQFAGVVIAGQDLDDRLQIGWSSDALSFQLLEGGVLSDGVDVFHDQFQDGEWVETDLQVRVQDGFYTVSYLPEGQPPWEIDTGELPASMDRVGVIVYGTQGGSEDLAAFDRFVVE